MSSFWRDLSVFGGRAPAFFQLVAAARRAVWGGGREALGWVGALGQTPGVLKHVVFMKLAGGPQGEAAGRIAAGLRGLPAQIPQLQALEVGADVVQGERSYDLALIASFADLEAMKAYQVHPAHVAVLAEIKAAASAVAAVDFECPA